MIDPAHPPVNAPADTQPANEAARPHRRGGAARPGALSATLRTHVASAGALMSRWPWWVQVTGLYVAARLVSACIFMAAALHQGVNPWFPARPDYWSLHQHLGRALVRGSTAERLS